MGAGKNKEKVLAEALFMDTAMTLTDIAEKVGITMKTLIGWKEKGKWEIMKTANTTTRQSIISRKWMALGFLVDRNLDKLKDGTWQNADGDAEHKLSMSIRALTNEETISGYVQSFESFMKYLQNEDPAFARLFAKHSKTFILIKAGELA